MSFATSSSNIAWFSSSTFTSKLSNNKIRSEELAKHIYTWPSAFSVRTLLKLTIPQRDLPWSWTVTPSIESSWDLSRVASSWVRFHIHVMSCCSAYLIAAPRPNCTDGVDEENQEKTFNRPHHGYREVIALQPCCVVVLQRDRSCLTEEEWQTCAGSLKWYDRLPLHLWFLQSHRVGLKWTFFVVMYSKDES